MKLLNIAQKNFAQVVGGINKEEFPQEYRNAFYMPLYFYLENSVEKAKLKILLGMDKDKYELPDIKEREKLIMSIKDRVVEALKTDMSGYDERVHGDYEENMAFNIIEEFCQ